MGRRGRYRGRVGAGGGGGASDMANAVALETTTDIFLTVSPPPSIINGLYSFTGNQMNFRGQIEKVVLVQQTELMNLNYSLQQLDPMMPPQLNPLMQPMGMPPPPHAGHIQQMNINMIGTKTKSSSMCCYVSTVLCGSFCIFPLCFMCCMWWKKAINPRYELTVQAYRDIGYFVEKTLTASNLTLSVVDNTFNLEKARILYDSLSKSRITNFIFVNKAFNCNCNGNESDDFKENMLPIKSLNMTSSITWGEMIL